MQNQLRIRKWEVLFGLSWRVMLFALGFFGMIHVAGADDQGVVWGRYMRKDNLCWTEATVGNDNGTHLMISRGNPFVNMTLDFQHERLIHPPGFCDSLFVPKKYAKFQTPTLTVTQTEQGKLFEVTCGGSKAPFQTQVSILVDNETKQIKKTYVYESEARVLRFGDTILLKRLKTVNQEFLCEDFSLERVYSKGY